LTFAKLGGESEVFLGNEELAKSFQIITKASMGMEAGADKDGVMADCNASLKALHMNNVCGIRVLRWSMLTGVR
jgi:aryl-alcohol dehydrogenase-like predicted oxidoreductase